jgi:hypothetical protein
MLMTCHAILRCAEEELFELELAVARRADQLSLKTGYSLLSARQVWLRAELDVFERVDWARPMHPAADAMALRQIGDECVGSVTAA